MSSNANNIYTKLLLPLAFHFESGFVKRQMQSKEIELYKCNFVYFFFFINVSFFKFSYFRIHFREFFSIKILFFFYYKMLFCFTSKLCNESFSLQPIDDLKTNCTIFYSVFILLTYVTLSIQHLYQIILRIIHHISIVCHCLFWLKMEKGYFNKKKKISSRL